MIDRHTLKFAFGAGNLPNFFCPKCNKGILTPTHDISSYHPKFSQNVFAEEWADWENIELRLSAILHCNNSKCGEQATLHAIGGVEPDYDDDNSHKLEDYFFIKSFYPSPHIISLPSGLPDTIKSELFASFDAYWGHKGLATNAIRNCIEAFLEHFGVPNEVDGKWVSLGNRLLTYSKGQPNHAEFFRILKPLVNSASHGDKIEVDTILDIYEALEIFLEAVFNDRAKRFEELTVRLRDSNTKKTKPY